MRIFLDKLWIREGDEDVTVKMLVAHDTPPISFDSLEFRTVCNDLDGDVAVRCIQASATSRADYLLGPPKTMNAKHWTQLLQANPRLAKLDVHVVMERLKSNPRFQHLGTQRMMYGFFIFTVQRTKKTKSIRSCAVYTIIIGNG